MKWERLENGDWQAFGKDGDFLLWKSKTMGKLVWKARFRNSDKETGSIFQLKPSNSLVEAKKVCEMNIHWEEDKKPIKEVFGSQKRNQLKKILEDVQMMRCTVDDAMNEIQEII